MMHQHVTQEALRRWLTGLMADHTVIAPVARTGRTPFLPVATVDEIAWAVERADGSAKTWFFPASEALFTLRPDAGTPQMTVPNLDQQRVLFGCRPCDAHALAVLDRLLLDDPVDVYYAARRANTALVGVACADGGYDGCFCDSVGGAPADRTHLDVLLTPVADGYLVDPVTDRGRDLLAGAALTDTDVPLPTVAPPAPDLLLAPPEVWRAHFGDALWAEVAERCLGCRVCTYNCPVCYCFDVRDRVTPDGGVERLRCWDSCQGGQCFAIAGGHNPRPTQLARQRQRYMHKFLYYPDREGMPLCVGCGRCVVECPANIDIREVMAAMASAPAALEVAP